MTEWPITSPTLFDPITNELKCHPEGLLLEKSIAWPSAAKNDYEACLRMTNISSIKAGTAARNT